MDNINHHFIYPIADEAIGDDYGAYVYACPAVPILREGALLAHLYVLDCWLVNEYGERHPEYNESPLPIRVEHLGDHVKGVVVLG